MVGGILFFFLSSQQEQVNSSLDPSQKAKKWWEQVDS